MLSPGNHSLTVTATNALGSTSYPSTPVSVKVSTLAEPCNGKGYSIGVYMSGFADEQQPSIAPGPLPGQFVINALPRTFDYLTASGGLGFATVNVQVKVDEIDGEEVISVHVGNDYAFAWDDPLWVPVNSSTAGWFATDRMRRFQVPFSNVTFDNGQLAPSVHSGTALFHVFCASPSDYPAQQYNSMKVTFLKPSGYSNYFNGPVQCAFSEYEASGKSVTMLGWDYGNGNNANAWQSPILPIWGSGGPVFGHFGYNEVGGSCQFRYDWSDPLTEYTEYYANNVLNFSFSDIPYFQPSWTPAFQELDGDGLGTGRWYMYSPPPPTSYIGGPASLLAIDWSKPVIYRTSPDFYFEANYVTYSQQQNISYRSDYFPANSAADLTRYRVKIEPDVHSAPLCSCALDATVYPYCFDPNHFYSFFYTGYWKMWDVYNNCNS